MGIGEIRLPDMVGRSTFQPFQQAICSTHQGHFIDHISDLLIPLLKVSPNNQTWLWKLVTNWEMVYSFSCICTDGSRSGTGDLHLHSSLGPQSLSSCLTCNPSALNLPKTFSPKFIWFLIQIRQLDYKPSNISPLHYFCPSRNVLI